MLLNELFHNTSYDYSLFSDDTKADLEGRIFTKSVRGFDVPYIICAIRKKEIKLTPEEAFVNSLYINFSTNICILQICPSIGAHRIGGRRGRPDHFCNPIENFRLLDRKFSISNTPYGIQQSFVDIVL